MDVPIEAKQKNQTGGWGTGWKQKQPKSKRLGLFDFGYLTGGGGVHHINLLIYINILVFYNSDNRAYRHKYRLTFSVLCLESIRNIKKTILQL